MTNKPHTFIDSIIMGFTGSSVNLIVPSHGTLCFDNSGRLFGHHKNHTSFSRGLDGRIIKKTWSPGKPCPHPQTIKELSKREIHQFHSHITHILRKCLRSADVCHMEIYYKSRKKHMSLWRIKKTLTALLHFTEERLTTDAQIFKQTYRPIGILPPDQYLSLVIQVTEGCSWNKCTFCRFYAGVSHKIRSQEEIMTHIDQVRQYVSSSLSRRCSLFLGDANAFDARPDTLIWACQTLSRLFPKQASPQSDGMGGIYSFGEVNRLLQWEKNDLIKLRLAGLRRVFIGVETGADKLRQWTRKPGTSEQVWQTVQKIKSSGISVGLVLLAGIGGKEHSALHATETEKLLLKMPLNNEDIVYFSPLSQGPSDKWTKLSRTASQHQIQDMTSMIQSLPTPPKTGLYNINEYLY